MKRILVLFFMLYSFTSYTQCLVNSLTINTGYNPNTGTAIAANQPDPKWSLTNISAASNTTGAGGPYTLNTQALVHTVTCCQSLPPAGSQWIKHYSPNTLINSGNGPFWVVFTRTFRTCVDANITFNIRAAADNWFTNLRVDNMTPNLVPDQPSGVNNNNYFLPGTAVTSTVFLTAGTHTITVQVNNAPSAGNNPSNFLLVGNITSTNPVIVSEINACTDYVCTPPVDSCEDRCYWRLVGNDVSLPGNSNVFGTINNADVEIRTTNIPRGVISANGDWGMGTQLPEARQHIFQSERDKHLDLSGLRKDETFESKYLASK